jgi:hypothetical protein
MRFRRGQNRYNLSIFTVLFISLSLFIFLYLGLHFFIYYIFLSKPLTLVLIPTWLSTFFICFKRNFGKIKIERKTKEKVIFYSIFVTFLVFYFYFYHTPALIVAQTHYPNRCSSSSDCPSGQFCCGGSCTTLITCTIKTCNIYGACQYETLPGLYCPGTCPGDRCNTDADCAGGGWCGPASCNLNDGWYCEGDIRQYRDYFCGAGNACTYNVLSIYDCNSLDYTISYCDGDTVVKSITDAYCSEGSCKLPPPRIETYYCSDYCSGPKLVDNTCSNGQCVSRSITCSKVCGAQCENNNDCPSGYHCGPSCVCQSGITTTTPSCPSGTTCVDRVLCGRAGGSCVSSCGSYECCCSIPTTYTTTTTRTTTPTTTTSSTTTTPTTTFTTTYTTTTTRFTTTTSGGGITTTTRTTTPTPTTTRPPTTTTFTTTTTRFTTTPTITTTTRTTTPTPTTTRPPTTTFTTTFTTTYTTTTTRFTTTTTFTTTILTTTPTITTTPTTRTTTPILTTTFVTTTRQFTTTPTPTTTFTTTYTTTTTRFTTTTIPGACINANGICEPGETQQGCPADCKTIVFTPYKYTANYNPVNLTIQFNDSRIYYDEPIKLEIYFINSTHRIPWNGSDCPIFGKVFNKTNETSIPNTNITYHINVPGLANAITVNTICRVPGFDKLAPGSYTISVKPTIYSPITLSQASTKINIYNNFLEYLLLVIRNLIFG